MYDPKTGQWLWMTEDQYFDKGIGSGAFILGIIIAFVIGAILASIFHHITGCAI